MQKKSTMQPQSSTPGHNLVAFYLNTPEHLLRQKHHSINEKHPKQRKGNIQKSKPSIHQQHTPEQHANK